MASARTKLRHGLTPLAKQGFTLIELLVVIAIIAIIAAILFPVFAKVREKARQTTVLANFEKIQRGLGEYQLDYHRYPNALYGYAKTGGTMGTRTTSHGAPDGLYPQFISDVGVFQDPDNPDNDKPALTVSPTVAPNQLSGSTLTPISPAPLFYKADAYDVNPQMSADGRSLSTTNYVVRYQTSWTGVGTADAVAAGANAARQLRFPNPPGDTFVTLTTYHVPSNAVLVLWQSGSAKTLDPTRLKPYEPNGTFWQMTPGRG